SWVALSGELERYAGQKVPRDFSPCGVVVDRNEPLLIEHPAQFYPYIDDLHCPAAELLLVPFSQNGVPSGTIWVVHHEADGRFTHEDLRLVSNLTAFAATAVGAVELADKLKETNRLLGQLFD